MGQGSLQLGELGPYTLLEQIAVGGMAEIYLAKTRGVAGFEKVLCLKIIHPNFADDAHFIDMLIDEAKISVGLNHANIVQIFDLGRERDTYFIAMEYIDGLDLFKVMRKLSEHDYDVPIEIAAYVSHEICTGLDYAHRKRDERGQPLSIIHRDISPQNILISTSGEVKIVDFGIAKATSRSRKTQAGVIKGKYYYMSPEQAWGDPVDQRTDIFSAGIILYEVLTGQMLYLEEDMHRLLDMVRKADIPRPSTRRPEIPPQLENVVMKALAKRPADRWQTAHEFQVALTNFLFSYAPDFTPTRLADLVERTMSDDLPAPPEPAPKPPPRELSQPRGQTRQVDVESLMSRVDFSPRTENSVIFRVGDMLEQGPAPVSMEEDRGEKTQISGPPAMMHGLFPEPIPGAASDADVAGTWPAAEDDPTMISRNPPLRREDHEEVTQAQPRHRRRSRQIPAEVVVPRPLVADPNNVTEVSRTGDTDMTPTPLMEITSRPGPGLTPEIKTDPQPQSPGQHARPNWGQAPRAVPPPPPAPPPVPIGSSWPSPPAPAAPPSPRPPMSTTGPPPQPAPQHLPPSGQIALPAAGQQPAAPPVAVAPLHIAPAAPQPVAPQPAQIQPFQPAPAPPQDHWPQPAVASPAPNWPPVAAPLPANPVSPQLVNPQLVNPLTVSPQPVSPQQPPSSFPHASPNQAPQATPTMSVEALAMFHEADNLANYRAKRRSRKLVFAGLFGFLGLGLIVAAIFFLLLPGRVDPTVEVISVPKGASVEFDGKQLGSTTPVVIPVTDLEQRHTVKVSLTNFQVWQRKLTLSEDDPRVRVLAVLTPIYGKLEVRSTPKGADVYINGEHRGKTPTTVDNLPPDEDVSIELRKRGYKPATRTLKWSGQTYLNAEITLRSSR